MISETFYIVQWHIGEEIQYFCDWVKVLWAIFSAAGQCLPSLALNVLMYYIKIIPADFVFIIILEVNFSGMKTYGIIILSLGIE